LLSWTFVLKFGDVGLCCQKEILNAGSPDLSIKRYFRICAPMPGQQTIPSSFEVHFARQPGGDSDFRDLPKEAATELNQALWRSGVGDCTITCHNYESQRFNAYFSQKFLDEIREKARQLSSSGESHISFHHRDGDGEIQLTAVQGSGTVASASPPHMLSSRDINGGKDTVVSDETETTQPRPKPSSSQSFIDDAPQAFYSDLDKATAPIIQKINAWLLTLEGEKFDANDPNDETRLNRQIALVRQLARRSGCEVVFDGEPVRFAVSRQARYRCFKILLRSPDASKDTRYSATKFPSVRFVPVES
jgi:hypothetical protein